MRCPHCYNKISEDSTDRFCTRCGYPLMDKLKRECPRCQKSNAAENLFCIDCGMQLRLRVNNGNLETATSCLCPLEPVDEEPPDK